MSKINYITEAERQRRLRNGTWAHALPGPDENRIFTSAELAMARTEVEASKAEKNQNPMDSLSKVILFFMLVSVFSGFAFMKYLENWNGLSHFGLFCVGCCLPGALVVLALLLLLFIFLLSHFGEGYF